MKRFITLIFLFGIVVGVISVSHAEEQTAAIHGRVFVNNNPAYGARIIVEDIKTLQVIASTISVGMERGPDAGSYRITGLPAKKKLAVTASWKGTSGRAKRIKLRPGQDKKVHLYIDIRPTHN